MPIRKTGKTRGNRSRTSAGIRALKINNYALEFEVIYSNRRTLGISVHPDGRVIARAPHKISLHRVDQFIAEHVGWILKQQRRIAQRQQAQPLKITYRNGDTLFFLGETYVLCIDMRRTGEAQISDSMIVVPVKSDDPAVIERALMRWYRRQAEMLFNQRLALCFERIQHWKVAPRPLAIRRMKSRWGSCTSKGKITLSLRLTQAPVELIDYVILHELCHLREMNHGRGFYKLLAEICPDWRVRKSALTLTPTNW